MKAKDILNSIGVVSKHQGFRQAGYHIWGSSVVKGEDGRYHMFASRVPDYLPFHPGWMIASEIVRAVADNPMGPYEFAEVVLPIRGAQYWDGRSTHNPRILKIEDKFVLYYMGSTHPFEDISAENVDQLDLESKWAIAGRANKRIGIAVSDSVCGPWKRMDEPVLPTKPNTFYSFLTSNPSACVGFDGRVYLMFKSREYQPNNTHGDMNIGMAVADHFKGPYKVITNDPLFSKERFGEIEDPFMWSDANGFHMLAKDQTGKITGRHGYGIMGHSHNAIDWQLDTSPLAYTKSVTWDNGMSSNLGNMERCSGLFDANGKLTHLFFAVWEDEAGFGSNNVINNAWNMPVSLDKSCLQNQLSNEKEYTTETDNNLESHLGSTNDLKSAGYACVTTNN